MKKTNAMRILDSKKIPYNSYEYDVSDGKTDGVSVAKKLKQDPKVVFKTLVTKGASREHYVFVIPVGQELDLKKAAKAAGEKKIDMISMKELLATTGYVHGGCSPVGMKKLFKTYVDESARANELIICSGGKVGVQIEVKVGELLELVGGVLGDLV
jgi:Cys-tRNA(Pro)/Cys-tRNA(Cys) deacylase